jgi:hypothetical protein
MTDTHTEALVEALTPSGDTKAAYSGEFMIDAPYQGYDEDGEPLEGTYRLTVPWTTIKEIMAAIRTRAAIEALPARNDERALKLVEAVEALGAMPEGYCFCSKDRIGDDSKVHEPECADLRAVLADTQPSGETR